MRRRKLVVLLLLGVTVLTVGWYVSSSYGNSGNGFNIFNIYSKTEHIREKVGDGRNVIEIEMEQNVPESTKDVKNEMSSQDQNQDKRNYDIDEDEGDIVPPVKDKPALDTQTQTKQVIAAPPNDDNEENSLLDVMQFIDKDWITDENVCSPNKNDKFLKAQMHTPKGDVTIYVHDPEEDVHVSGGLVEHGEWEPHLINLVYSLLQKDPGLQFIDLGANIGVFSLAVAKLGRKVIAVEPLSVNLKRLCKSVLDNEFEDYITILHNALSDTHEKVTLGKKKGNVGGSFINKDENLNNIQDSSISGEFSDVVNTAKLDDLLNLPDFNSFKKVIIKMDVEGYESHVLESAERFFRKVDVQVVLMEWMWHKTGADSNKIINFFGNHGYEPVNPNGFNVLEVRSSNSWPVDVLWRPRIDSHHDHIHEDGAKDQQVVEQKSSDSSSTVKMYRRDMTKWNYDNTMCQAQTKFELAKMHTSAGDVNIYVHNPNVDVHVSGGLLRNGAWEPHLIQLMFSLLGQDPTLQFIDLGANLGVFSLAVARYGRKVIAVEPLSINLQRFCKSIKDNHFEDKITVITNALGDKRENVSFGMDVGNIGGTFIMNEKNMEKKIGSAVGGMYDDKVLTALVNDMLNLPGLDFKKVVIKMDVEGYEHFVLKGADEFFSKVDVQAVLMEWMWHKAGSGAEEIFKFYVERGYEPFDPLANVVLNTQFSQSWPIDVLWRKKNAIPNQNVGSLPNQAPQQTQTGVQMYRRDMIQWIKDTSMCAAPSNMLKANMHTDVGDVIIYVHEPSVDVHVSGSLVRGGSWEPHLIRLMFNLLQQEPDLHFIDLGANLGVFSLAVAKLGRRVIAVEPLSINLRRFCSSITANKFENFITVVTNALSEKRENVMFGKDQGNIGGTFVLNDKNLNKFNGSPVNGKYDDVVMSAQLDDLLELPGFNFKKVVMKIDVEGYEHHVLRAAEKFFGTVDVQAVLMEWLWQKEGDSAQEIMNFFTKFNYEPYNPGYTMVLNMQQSASWPVDVIWKKKKSGNPFQNEQGSVQRNSVVPVAPKQENKERGDVPVGNSIIQQSSMTTSKKNPEALNDHYTEDKVQKNLAYNTEEEKTGAGNAYKYGVRFYRNDGRSWIPDESTCTSSEDFLKANLHSPAGDLTIYVHNPADDFHVSGGLIRNEAWEPHLILLMYDLLNKDSQLQFVDLGANLGVFSLAVAKLGRRVIAAEPLSINLRRFCKSIIANHFEDKITVVTNALSDKIENVSFGKDVGNIGGTYVLNDKNRAKVAGSDAKGQFDDVVLTAKLDSFLNILGFNFTKVIMKIDVEGYEHHVFRAAHKFFKQVDVQAVLMEWMWHKSGSDSREILNFFEEKGYEPIDPHGNSRLDYRQSGSWPVDVLWKKVDKSLYRAPDLPVPAIFTSRVQVYRHDMTQWKADDSICLNLPPMTKGQITNSIAGPFTIYVYDPSEDQYVSGGIIREGGWETHLVNTVISLLRKDTDLQFVDLGANLGVYALAVAKMGRNVVAVEPLSSNVQRLCHSVYDNNLGGKVRILYNALSDKRGHVSLGKDQKNVGGTFVVDRGNQNKVQGSNVNGQFSDDVITAKLDDILKLPGFDFKKAIMKMDVEGYEGYVLNGGQMFFEMVDVQAVFMEWMWLKTGTVTQDVVSFFTSRGYKPYISTNGRELQIDDARNWPVDMMWKKY